MIFKKRNLISNKEGKISIIQIIGFGLISLGIIAIVVGATVNIKCIDTPSIIAMAFFITMLGFAFAFPSLLEGNDGISTMRIVVFMMVNVICLLLIKIGWNKSSLNDIGLDQWWMGVIAFVFGAKATQSYFESKLSVPKIETSKVGTLSLEYSNSEIAKQAVLQYRDELRANYPNIKDVTDILKDGKSIVTIFVKDNNTDSIPKELKVTLPSCSTKIQPQIIPNCGVSEPQIGQASDELSDLQSPKYLGSICCIVEELTNPDFKGIVTSGHVFTHGKYFDYGGYLGNINKTALINGNPIAKLYFQQMKENQDLAIIELIDKSNLLENYISFKDGFYDVTENDLVYPDNQPNVVIQSRPDKDRLGSNIRNAYILGFNKSVEINYSPERTMRNIILIGSSSNMADSECVSMDGDSGSCAYHIDGKLIGILVGGDLKFNFVLPIQKTLEAFNFKIL